MICGLKAVPHESRKKLFYYGSFWNLRESHVGDHVRSFEPRTSPACLRASPVPILPTVTDILREGCDAVDPIEFRFAETALTDTPSFAASRAS